MATAARAAAAAAAGTEKRKRESMSTGDNARDARSRGPCVDVDELRDGEADDVDRGDREKKLKRDEAAWAADDDDAAAAVAAAPDDSWDSVVLEGGDAAGDGDHKRETDGEEEKDEEEDEKKGASPAAVVWRVPRKPVVIPPSAGYHPFGVATDADAAASDTGGAAETEEQAQWHRATWAWLLRDPQLTVHHRSETPLRRCMLENPLRYIRWHRERLAWLDDTGPGRWRTSAKITAAAVERRREHDMSAQVAGILAERGLSHAVDMRESLSDGVTWLYDPSVSVGTMRLSSSSSGGGGGAPLTPAPGGALPPQLVLERGARPVFRLTTPPTDAAAAEQGAIVWDVAHMLVQLSVVREHTSQLLLAQLAFPSELVTLVCEHL